MKTIKYRVGNSERHVGILTNTYNKTYSHMKNLCDILMTDYPYITCDDIEITTLGGPKHRGMNCVEANVREVTDEYETYPVEWIVTI